MKKYIVLTLLTALSTSLWSQGTIDDVLQSIAVNNKQLQAAQADTDRQKLEGRTANNLPDPTFSYAHMWGKHDKDATISELSISQGFDFPTLYAIRKRMNNLREGAFDSRYIAARREVLLRAKELCLDIIMLSKQQTILNERLNNAQQLADMYADRLKAGDANILETNKINLELLNVKTEAAANETALQNNIRELTVLNGNQPVQYAGWDYSEVVLPADYVQLKEELLATDMELHALDRETAASRQELSLSRSQWLPKLELGYRRNTESGDPFNGLVVGFSIPLFENRNKVKKARMQTTGLTFQRENRLLEVESELAGLYREATTARASMQEYEKVFAAQSDLDLLHQALMGGQISMIEYFVEVSVVYQSQLNYLQLQNTYQKAVARIYRNRL